MAAHSDITNIIKKDDGTRCGHINEIQVDLDEIHLTHEFDNKASKIMIDDTIGVKMKMPSGDLISILAKDAEVTEITDDTILNCIEFIWEGEDVFYPENETKEEMIQFVEGIPSSAMLKIREFLDKLPKLKMTVDFQCMACGATDKVEVENIQDFLD